MKQHIKNIHHYEAELIPGLHEEFNMYKWLIYDKLTVNNILNVEKLKVFSLRSGACMPMSIILTQHRTGNFTQNN
jgi:hypothetical protein